MSLGEWKGFDWDGLGPAAAVVALGVLALLPDRPLSTVVDVSDHLAALESAPAGQGIPWRDRTSGKSGVVVPAAMFRDDNGLWCRHYRVSYGDNSTAVATGLACRMTDGRWRDLTGGVRAGGASATPNGQLAAIPNR